MPDGIDDGISTEAVLECFVSAIFQWKQAAILRYSLLKADNCCFEFPVSLTVSIQRDKAETLSRLGSRLGIDNRVGVRVSGLTDS